MNNTTLCNHGRCRKPAIVGFRPFENGYDVTSKRGKQNRCELHGAWLFRDGKLYTPATWVIKGLTCEHCSEEITWQPVTKTWAAVTTGLVFCSAPHRGTSHKPSK